jgi:hypothetical protein
LKLACGAATQSVNFVRRALLVDLVAADFNNVTFTWCVGVACVGAVCRRLQCGAGAARPARSVPLSRLHCVAAATASRRTRHCRDNRATAGAFSNTTNGDFVALQQGLKRPYLKTMAVAGGASPVSAVWFPDGGGRVQTSTGSAALTNAGIYGAWRGVGSGGVCAARGRPACSDDVVLGRASTLWARETHRRRRHKRPHATAPPPSSPVCAGGGDFSVEAWVFTGGSESASFEVPVFQWGTRNVLYGGGAYLGVGSNAAFSAGGYFGVAYDVAWGATSSTEAGPGGGQRPRAGEWHHVAMTGGAVNPAGGGYHSFTTTLYVDGVLSRQYALMALPNVQRSAVMVLGQYVDAGLLAPMTTSGLWVGQLRLHDGQLTPDEVAYNYALDAALYRPSATVQPIAVPTPSPSPSTGSAAACPTTWSSAPTHSLRTVSLGDANDASAYARHCTLWLYMRGGFLPATALSAADASYILRLGADGTPGSVTIQSSNYPDRGECACTTAGCGEREILVPCTHARRVGANPSPPVSPRPAPTVPASLPSVCSLRSPGAAA